MSVDIAHFVAMHKSAVDAIDAAREALKIADELRRRVEHLSEAARLSAELAPRVPDGNKFGYDWTIPNPVIAALGPDSRGAGVR